MLESYSHEAILSKVHENRNKLKYYCYFTGFLEGVAASDFLEDGEIEPLITLCREFVEITSDPDALDIEKDFEIEVLEIGSIFDAARIRKADIDFGETRSAMNWFLGFCAGIACDGKICEKEAASLCSIAEQHDAIRESAGVDAILNSCRDALEDGRVDESESQEIGYWISRIVGDSYSDTGISALHVPAVYEEFKLEGFPGEHQGRVCALTGTFDTSPRRRLEEALQAEGLIVKKSVSGKTDYLIIGGEVSPHWIEINRGTKLIKALSLREAGELPRFISEAQILRSINPN